MLGLPSLSIWSKLAIFAAWTLTVAVFVGVKVDDYVTSRYETKILAEKVHFVEKERTVAVLDTKTLQASVARERARWDSEQQEKKKREDDINAHANDTQPWCSLSPDELRDWNAENSGLVGLPTTSQPTGGKELPGSPTSTVGESRGPVEK